MVNFKIIILLAVLLMKASIVNASSFTYEKRTKGKHIIHIVTINPKDYITAIVKANDGAIGRETVPAIAKRSQATIAINGGFFEIGGNKDGMPSKTLIINGHQYNIIDEKQSVIMVNSGVMSIMVLNPKNYQTSEVSILSGIPLLIDNNKIPQFLNDKNSDFYVKPNARTAIGIKANNTIVVVIAEHNYSRDILDITIGEVQSLMKKKGSVFANKYHHQNYGSLTFDQLKKVLKEEFSSDDGIQGLTILELSTGQRD